MEKPKNYFEIDGDIRSEEDEELDFEMDGHICPEDNRSDFISYMKQKYTFKPAEFVQDIDPEEEERRFRGVVEDLKAGRTKISELSAVDLIKLNIYCKERLEEMQTSEYDDEDCDEGCDEDYDEDKAKD